MIIAINYANKDFQKAQKLNLKTALKWGADKVIGYTPEDIDDEFFVRNKDILSAKKGNGYYLWKPYFLNKAYQELSEGDYLIYTDAGSIFINKIQYLIDCMEKEKIELMAFSLPSDMLEKKYTKRDSFILMDCDTDEIVNTPQTIGGYVLLKKSNRVESFLKEDLLFAQDARIITDSPNVMGKENYPEWITHRHDQSVFSLMCKKYGIKRFRDPSQYGIIGKFSDDVMEMSDYPQIIESHRMNVGSLLELKIKMICKHTMDYIKCNIRKKRREH